jgi:adenosylcobinamide-phosphate synthase
MLAYEASSVLAALLIAALVDLVLGEPDWLYRRIPHPVVVIGRLASRLEVILLDPAATSAAKRSAGTMLVVMVTLASVSAGIVLAWLCRSLSGAVLLEGFVMSTLIAWRSLKGHVAAVADGLDRSLLEGRRKVALIVGRDPDRLNEHGVARAAVESLAENLSDGVLAPIFWGLFLGLPGMLAYKAINTLDSMVGHKNERYLAFGWASARLDDLVSWLPARLTAYAILLGAFLMPAARPAPALRAIRRDAPHHRSPNAGWPEAAMAGALRLRLAGPRSYEGRVVEDAWMGDGRADVTPVDIRAGIELAGRAYAIILGMTAVAWLLSIG